jgi:putative CRISPR-associated protein (TIGR02619 family)
LKQIEKLTAEELDKKGIEEKEKIEKTIKTYWLKENNTSAEIESIKKYMENNRLDINYVSLHFIATDTAESCLAMNMICDHFKKITTDVSVFIAKDLSLNNKDAYESKGFNNLLKIIDDIQKSSNDELVFNISGGYKGIIPYMTIYAQLIKANIFYLYEDASDIIEIPAMPLSLNINYCMEKLAAAQSDENEKVSNLIKVDSNYNLRPNNKEIVPITRMFNKEITEEFSLNTFLGILVETVLATTHPKEFDDSLKSYINQGTQNIYYPNGNLISDLDCKLVHGNEIGIVESKSINIIKDSKYNTHYGTLDKIPPKIDYFNKGDRYKVTHFILVLWDISSRQFSKTKVDEIKKFCAEQYPEIKFLIKKINIPLGNSVSSTIQRIMDMKGKITSSNFIDIN